MGEGELFRRDPRTRRIVDHAYQKNGATSSRYLASRGDWKLEETEADLRNLEREALVQFVGEPLDRIVSLRTGGDGLARGDLV